MGVVTLSVINCSPSDLLSHLIQLLAGETRRLSPKRMIYHPRSLPTFECNLPGFFFPIFLGKRVFGHSVSHNSLTRNTEVRHVKRDHGELVSAEGC